MAQIMVLKKKTNSYDKGLLQVISINSNFKKPLSTRCEHLQHWFNSLAKLLSHHCRKSSKRLYLEGPFHNLPDIFNAYKEKCFDDKIIPFSKPYFSNEMKNQNLSIYVPFFFSFFFMQVTTRELLSFINLCT